LRYGFTVKVIISLLILIFLTFGVGLYALITIRRTCAELYNEVDKAEKFILQENWIKAKEQSTLINNKWQKIRKEWAMLIDHREIDKMHESMMRMAAYIKLEEDDDALVECAVLKELIKHIADKDSPVIQNIF